MCIDNPNNPNNYRAAMPSTVKVGDILVILHGSSRGFWYHGREIHVTALDNDRLYYVPLTDNNTDHRSFFKDQVTAFHVKSSAPHQEEFIDGMACMITRLAEINNNISDLSKERDEILAVFATQAAVLNSIITANSIDN